MNTVKRALNKAKRLLTPYLTFGKNGKFKASVSSLPLADGKDVLVVFETSFGWDGIMRQRPQQTAMSFDDNVTVFYHSSKDNYPDKTRCRKVADGVYVLNLDLYRKYLFEAAKKEYKDLKKILIVYSTDPVSISLIEKYEAAGFTVIYEYVDDLDPALSAARVYKKLLKKHEYMTSRKVKTVCTATRLYESVKDLTPAELITNGCDYEHFKSREGIKRPDEMERFAGKKVIGYYGAVAEWMDYDLLRRISDSGEYEIVLLGISYDGSFEASGLAENDHIHFLGKKSYDELPSYAAFFDVCVIPFRKCDLTESTSPVKLFEYMAAEKPIVTTDLAECRKYKSVFCAKSHDEFLEKLKEAYDSRDNEEYRALLRQEAAVNTWESKCSQIIRFALDKE